MGLGSDSRRGTAARGQAPWRPARPPRLPPWSRTVAAPTAVSEAVPPPSPGRPSHAAGGETAAWGASACPELPSTRLSGAVLSRSPAGLSMARSSRAGVLASVLDRGSGDLARFMATGGHCGPTQGWRPGSQRPSPAGAASTHGPHGKTQKRYAASPTQGGRLPLPCHLDHRLRGDSRPSVTPRVMASGPCVLGPPEAVVRQGLRAV